MTVAHALSILASLIPLFFGARLSEAPCLRPSRAGTQVQGEVRVCPGKYRIADPGERGVIIAAASGTRIDLTGVTLESGDSIPGRYLGIGIASRGVDAVSIVGGSVRGYRFGLRIQGGRGHRVSGIDLSGSRTQTLGSTSERADTNDRLDAGHLKPIEVYGGGILLLGTENATITGVTAVGAQNGIGLIDARGSYVAENELSGNSGWGIHLWHSSHNTIERNTVARVRRCETGGGCEAAALLVREGSDSNTFSDNDLSGSSTGVIVAGGAPLTRPSIGNLFHRNDASLSVESGFVARQSWGTIFLDNRADSSASGFRLVRVSATTARGNTVIGSREAAIAAFQGADNALEQNVLLGGKTGIEVVIGDAAAPPGRGYRIDDNIISGVRQGIVLKGVSRGRVRGNVIDGVEEALVIDAAGHGTEVTGNVFLRAGGAYIVAPDLIAGGNFWATADASQAAAKVRGRISVLPWKPASAAGY
jgi:parallel beta-helix repeat protein